MVITQMLSLTIAMDLANFAATTVSVELCTELRWSGAHHASPAGRGASRRQTNLGGARPVRCCHWMLSHCHSQTSGLCSKLSVPHVSNGFCWAVGHSCPGLYEFVYTDSRYLCISSCWEKPWKADCKEWHHYWGSKYCQKLSCKHDERDRCPLSASDHPACGRRHVPTCTGMRVQQLTKTGMHQIQSQQQ